MKIKILWLVALLLLTSGLAWAQETQADDAPQILTTDLIRKQVLRKATKLVSFVFVDNNDIVEIEINDIPQDFERGKTVMINKKFQFSPGRTLIKVVAVDGAGNSREKSFLVGYKLQDQRLGTDDGDKEKKAGGLSVAVSASIAAEVDDNPTNDLSSPVKIGDMELTGEVDDSNQADNRKIVSATVVVAYGSAAVYTGMAVTDYEKEINKFLDSTALYFGGLYNLAFSDTVSLNIGAMVLDINVGGEQFAQNTSLTPSLNFSSKDIKGTYKHSLALKVASNDFAEEGKKDGADTSFSWVWDSADAENLDLFRSTIAFTSKNSATEESECTYYGFDFDWKNRWQSGFKWDLGFSIMNLAYKNQLPLSTETPLGENRVDLPLGFHNGFGWHFNDKWNLMYNYQYVFNLSNESPYIRSIHGLTINGGF